MQFQPKAVFIAVAGMMLAQAAIAQDNPPAKVHQLATITVTAHPLNPSENDFAGAVNVLEKEQLSQGATTLGNALSGQLGIHSDNFGAGASRPVIRGQTAPRVKVLSDSSEVMDASQVSPDHAVTVEPSLATKIEVLRGPSTLLYGGGAIGGVVNVLDEKIPTQMPENGLSGEIHLRGDTAANEKLAAGGVTVALGEQVALHLEGDKRDAKDYKVSQYFVHDEHDHDHVDGNEEEHSHWSKRVAGTWHKGENAGIGLSWVGDDGYLGVSYSQRHDQYGLPGHSHEYEHCHPHGNKIHCEEHDHDEDATIADAHDDHDHDEAEHHHDDVPWVNLKSKRVDVRGDYLNPFAGVDKVRARFGYVQYQHEEIEDGKVGTTFKNRGLDGRLEVVHSPLGGFEGVIGVQGSRSTFDTLGEEKFLPKNTTDILSAFVIEHYQLGDVHFELGGRIDNQKIKVDESGYKDYSGHALSASAAANWEFLPDYTASVTFGYGERMPNMQELYAKGVHLATNTYEIGTDNLDKEKSKNVELAVRKSDGDFTFAINTFYNRVNDYIYGNTLDREENFRLIQYRQTDVDFFGAEGQIGYQLTPIYQGQIFADYVRAKSEKDGDLPRIPAARTGVRLNADFHDGIHGGIEYVYGFKQKHIAEFEEPTADYHLLNLNVSYDKDIGDRYSYQVYLQANNLLDQTYFNHASYLSTIPQAGRNFTAGLRFKF